MNYFLVILVLCPLFSLSSFAEERVMGNQAYPGEQKKRKGSSSLIRYQDKPIPKKLLPKSNKKSIWVKIFKNLNQDSDIKKPISR